MGRAAAQQRANLGRDQFAPIARMVFGFTVSYVAQVMNCHASQSIMSGFLIGGDHPGGNMPIIRDPW